MSSHPCSDSRPNVEKKCCGGCTSPTSPERRSFLKYVLGFFALLWAGMASSPILQYLTSANKATASSVVSSVNVGKLADFPKGSGKNVEFGGKPALVIRDLTGAFYAYSAVCTHLGCTVQFQSSENTIFCACHGGQYDPKTGQNIAGPPPKPLSTYKVLVDGDNVILNRA